MPGYRAKFTGGLRLRSDEAITMTLGISMDCIRQSGEQFAAFLGLIIKHRIKIRCLKILITDDLYRHYRGWIPSTPELERLAMAEREYTSWLEENGKYLRFLGDVDNVLVGRKYDPISVKEIDRIFGLSKDELDSAKTLTFKIMRWRTLLDSPACVAMSSMIDEAYNTSLDFKNIVENIASKWCSEGKHTLKESIDFLKEEIAVTLGPLKESIFTYPAGSFNDAILWAAANILRKELVYHAYSVELRGKQTTLDPTNASVASSAIDERKKAEEEGTEATSELEISALVELASSSLKEILCSRRGGRVEITVGKVAFKFAIDPSSPASLRHARSRSSSFFKQYGSDASDAFLSMPQRSVSTPK